MDLRLEHIAYLQDKWRTYLLGKDPYDQDQREKYSQVLEMIDEMKNNTEVGAMLYAAISRLHNHKAAKEERQAFQDFYLGTKK